MVYGMVCEIVTSGEQFVQCFKKRVHKDCKYKANKHSARKPVTTRDSKSVIPVCVLRLKVLSQLATT